MADTSKKEVQDSVAAQQKTLDALDDGSQCPSTGLKAVSEAKAKAEAAKAKATKAKAAHKKAMDAQVDFGTYAFSSLREGQCGVFLNDGAYLAAKTAVAAAQKASQKAEGEAK